MTTSNTLDYGVCLVAMVCLAACTQIVQAVDCNGNSVQDNLDISRGTCLDCNGNGIPDEGEGIKPVDWDDDTDVDGADLLVFEACFSGPMISVATGCEGMDLDCNGDIDQTDFGVFQHCYRGEGEPAMPGCRD
ncbi:MAG: hypothetical protein KA354_08570 [Phycisphaerae bacterium]|nr:hypothetical protein [Phycisphaerae bacterium]